MGTRSRFHSTSSLEGPALKPAVRGGPRRLISLSTQKDIKPRRQLGGGFVLLPDIARLSAYGVPLWISAPRKRAGQGELSSSSLFHSISDTIPPKGLLGKCDFPPNPQGREARAKNGPF